MFAFTDSFMMFAGPTAPASPPVVEKGASVASSTIATTRPVSVSGDVYYLTVVYKPGTASLTTPGGYTKIADETPTGGGGRIVTYHKASAGESGGGLNVAADAPVDAAWVFVKDTGTHADVKPTNVGFSTTVTTPVMSAAEASRVWHFIAAASWPRTFTPAGDGYTEEVDQHATNGPSISLLTKSVAAGTVASTTSGLFDPETSASAGDDVLTVSVLVNGSGSSGGTPPPAPLGTFYVGSHQHGLSAGDRFASGTFPQSTNTMEPFNFGPIRSHDVEALHDLSIGHMKWWTGSNRTPGAAGGNTYTWGTLDTWTDKVVGRGHPIILVAFGVPRHAARRSDYNDNYGIPGGTSGPINFVAYREAITDTVNHIVARHGLSAILAVEGWNEALGGGDNTNTSDFCNATGYSGANGLTPLQTMVADMQKAVWDGVKASNAAALHVIGPSMAYLSSGYLDDYFEMKTTGNVSIFSYCDAVAFHPYGMYDASHAWDATWANFAAFTAAIRARMTTAGISDYPIWATEVGIHAPWNPTSDAWWVSLTKAQKATALYDWIGTYYVNGWRGIITYSSDEDYQQPAGYDNGYIGSPGASGAEIRGALSSAYRDYQSVNIPDPTPNEAAPDGQVAEAWSLSFEDHFNGSALDVNKWSTPIWYGDQAVTEPGPNVTNSNNTVVNYDVNAASNSCLRIWPALQDGKYFYRTIHTDSMGSSSASGAKFRQKYGFFEMRAKLPIGRGCWPAFWLFGHYANVGGSPVRPEIDVMEAYCGGYDTTNNASPGWADSTLHPTTWATTFWSDTGDENARTKSGPHMMQNAGDLSADFHTYGMKWEPGGVFTWYIDGAQKGTTTFTAADKLDTYPLAIYLDLWFGSASGWANTGETPLGTSNAFEVDYVRAWTAR